MKVANAFYNSRTPESLRQSSVASEIHYMMPQHYSLIYHLEGTREALLSERIHVLDRDQVMLLEKGGKYAFKIPNHAFRAIHIAFELQPNSSNEVYAKGNTEFQANLIDVPRFITSGPNSRLRLLFDEAVHCYLSGSRLNEWKGELLVKQILLEMALTSEQQDQINRPVMHAIQIMQKSPHRNFTVEELAMAVSLSRSTLTRAFREVTKMSVKQYQIIMKVKIAASLFRTNPYCLNQEAACLLGFSDAYYFSRVFTRIMRETPQAYKNRVREYKWSPGHGES
ncbi:AraC family transcriptional regulator [Paenibacillus sp. PL2-23]|uniref:helix-turn-helix domain-containing protein n=1 Tax=Paenibacillus sp. PL2-23 TaxID=2100729 RepID=UPI0030FAA342